MGKEFILASSSRSRYKILKNSGFIFKKINPKCDEEKIKIKIFKLKKNPIKYVKKLSYEKANSISNIKKYKNSFIIGCDTIILLEKKIFDKAKTIYEAKKKITELSNKKHKIISGVTIIKNGKKVCSFHETTVVKIKKLTNLEIKKYLKKTGKQILNSVGCYQIESLGPEIIEKIEGDFFNVMGIPLFRLLKYTSNIK